MITRKGEFLGEARMNMRGGKGRAVLTELCGALPKHMRLFSTIALMPGDSIGYHVHEGETEIYYFLKGSARVLDNDVTHEVFAGDVITTPSGSGHSVENIGQDELVLLAAIVLD